MRIFAPKTNTMRMKPFLLLLTFAIFLFGTASAQTSNRYVEVEEVAPVVYRYVYINPLDQMFERDAVTGTLRLPDAPFRAEPIRGLNFRDTIFVNPLFLPVVFQGRLLPRDLSFFPTEDKSERGTLIPQRMTLAPQLAQLDFAQNVRRQFYINNPTLIRFSERDLPDPPAVSQEELLRSLNPFRGLLRTESTLELAAPTVEGAIIERRYWQRSGEHSLQFSQNFFSENWHRGGTNHMNLNNFHTIRANFRRDRVRFNNTFEWQLSLNNAPGDTLRNFSIGTDFVRYTGDFGIEAFGRGWTYSTNLRVRTPIFNTFPPNSDAIRSAFLSPLEANMGVGLKYEVDRRSERVRHRRFRWNLAIAPLSVDLIYVNHPDINDRRIEEGRNHNIDLGSTVTSNMIIDFNRFTTWTSRLEYFTTFSGIRTDFENTLNMALTNAFSTQIRVNMRFDDGVPADDRFGLLQVNQMLSFGLNYRW